MAVAVAVALGFFGPVSVGAHEGSPTKVAGTHRSTLVDVPDGVTAHLLSGRVPAIALTSRRAVVIFGEQGEPMARLRGATIEVNDSSATWRRTAESRGEPAGTGWRTITDAQLTWLEPRAQAQPADRGTRGWRVPVTIDGERKALVGETRWVAAASPADTDDDSPARLYGIGALVAATLALAVIQRRRGAAKGVAATTESPNPD